MCCVLADSCSQITCYLNVVAGSRSPRLDRSFWRTSASRRWRTSTTVSRSNRKAAAGLNTRVSYPRVSVERLPFGRRKSRFDERRPVARYIVPSRRNHCRRKRQNGFYLTRVRRDVAFTRYRVAFKYVQDG